MSRGRHPHLYTMDRAPAARRAILKLRAEHLAPLAKTQEHKDGVSFVLGHLDYVLTQPDILNRFDAMEDELTAL